LPSRASASTGVARAPFAIEQGRLPLAKQGWSAVCGARAGVDTWRGPGREQGRLPGASMEEPKPDPGQEQRRSSSSFCFLITSRSSVCGCRVALQPPPCCSTLVRAHACCPLSARAPIIRLRRLDEGEEARCDGPYGLAARAGRDDPTWPVVSFLRDAPMVDNVHPPHCFLVRSCSPDVSRAPSPTHT
jgi:hypothetical protein